jgi:hypothetical protein
MDVKDRQLAGAGQEAVLRGLALAAARSGCRFLEIGSWCGDSTLILANVVREFGGQLFCIDWWKGNAGTDLAAIADREDVFSLFWQRICRAGLEDSVMPLRGRSQSVMPVLKENSFHLIFIDADHRYQQVKQDIASAVPLVLRPGGILCGHDCEGKISDYEQDFLETGKDQDCFESVHCGVVHAVGEAFPDCSINHSIWSVRALDRANSWEATGLRFPDIPDSKQAPPPPIASTRSHNLIRYGSRVYAVPHGLADLDITDEKQRNQAIILSALTLAEAQKLAREAEDAVERARIARELQLRFSPTLREEGYLGFNIVAYAGCFYALAQNIGPVDVPFLTPDAIIDLQRRLRLFMADSHQAVRLQVQAAQNE